MTARARPIPASRTPGGVAVVLGEDIAQRGVADLSGALSVVPGVARVSDGPWGGEVSIRGRTRNSVILLVDGARVNTATDIGARLGLIDPAEVARVEVLKGPISALYGSGSLGGVVNVITRRAGYSATPTFSVEASAGAADNPGGISGRLAVSGRGPAYWLQASQTAREYGNYEDGAGETVRNSGFTDGQTGIRTARRWGAHHESEVALQLFRGVEIGVPGSGTAPLPAAADVTYESASRELLTLRHAFRPGLGRLEQSAVLLYYQRIEREVRIDNFPAGAPAEAVLPTGEHETYGAKWVNEFSLGSHQFAVGLDTWLRRLETDRLRILKSGQRLQETPIPDSSYLSSGVFAEDDWVVTPRWTVNAGGRIDAVHVENSAGGEWPAGESDETSWNLHVGASHGWGERLLAKCIAASGYRAASLEERYQLIDLGGGSVKKGNPGLHAERSAFFELGLSWLGDELFAAVSAFYNDLNDLISEQRLDEQTLVNANVSEAELYGCEAEVRWRVGPRAEMYGNLSHTIGRDTETHEDLAGVAPLSGLVGSRLRVGNGGWARVELPFAARQDDVPEGESGTPGWGVLNIAAGCRRAGARTERRVQVGVNNVFDRAYREHLASHRGATFNEPGRSVSIAFAVRY